MQKQLTVTYDIFPGASAFDEVVLELYHTALKAREKAYAPYSRFLVGCAALLENGQIVSGNNQENAAYPSGLCAERTAVFWAMANYPGVRIKKLFVIGAAVDSPSNVPIPPCGSCRQSLLEYEVKQQEPVELFFSSTEGPIYRVRSIRDLLPFSFDATYL